MPTFNTSLTLNATSGHIYTNGETIDGDFQINTTTKQANIKQINIKLIGVSTTEYVMTGGMNTHGDSATQMYQQQHNFLELQTELFPGDKLQLSNLNSGGYTFMSGSAHEYPFKLSLPYESMCCDCGVAQSLPSSLAKMKKDAMSGNIQYKIMVEVLYFASLGLKKSVIVEKCFEFSPSKSIISNVGQFPLHHTGAESHLFKGKLKKFIDTENGSSCVENHIKKAHKHTRLIRSLFNENYKNENYLKLIGNVPLSITLTNQTYSNSQPGSDLSSNLTFHLSTPAANMEGYTLQNGTSTKLGEFSISGLKVFLEGITDMKCEVFHKTIKERILLYQSKSVMEVFDIAFFTAAQFFENGEELLCKQIHLQTLLGTDKVNKVTSIKVPIDTVPNFDVCGILDRSYNCIAELTIKDEKQSGCGYTYKLKCGLSIGGRYTDESGILSGCGKGYNRSSNDCMLSLPVYTAAAA